MIGPGDTFGTGPLVKSTFPAMVVVFSVESALAIRAIAHDAPQTRVVVLSADSVDPALPWSRGVILAGSLDYPDFLALQASAGPGRWSGRWRELRFDRAPNRLGIPDQSRQHDQENEQRWQREHRVIAQRRRAERALISGELAGRRASDLE